MTDRFTDRLRAGAEPLWSEAAGHRFTAELCAGAIAPEVMARYLVQDHRFLDSFLTLLGAAMASADGFEARLTLGRFAGLVSGEENTYFLRAFAALGVTEEMRAAAPDAAPTAGFQGIMREAAATRSYAAALSVRRAPIRPGRLRSRTAPLALAPSAHPSRFRRDGRRGAGCGPRPGAPHPCGREATPAT